MNETAGHYVMRATNEDYVICETLVHVLWIGHHTEPEPFLGIRFHETNHEEFRGPLHMEGRYADAITAMRASCTPSHS